MKEEQKDLDPHEKIVSKNLGGIEVVETEEEKTERERQEKFAKEASEYINRYPKSENK